MDSTAPRARWSSPGHGPRLEHQPRRTPTSSPRSLVNPCGSIRQPGDPTAMAIARWDCEAGMAAACRALAATGTGAAAVADYAAACALGDRASCLLGAALPDAPDTRADIGTMAVRACASLPEARGGERARSEAACARAEAMGWRGGDVREVVVLRKVYTPQALLPGGTALSVNGGGVLAFTATGRLEFPLVPTEGSVNPGKVRALTLTPERHLVVLATDPFLAWDLHAGTVTRLEAWPRPPPEHPLADIAEGGRAATARLGGGERVGVWALPDGTLLGTLPRPEGKEGYGLRVNADGTRLAFVQKEGWRPADVAAGTVGDTRQGSWEAWLAGIEVPAAAASGGVLSPDGELLAVPEAEAVRLVRPDGQEVARIQLPELGGNPLLRRLLWSADGGRLLVPLHGAVAIVTRPKATATPADDLALLQGIRPLPALPPGGHPRGGPDGARWPLPTGGGAAAGGARALRRLPWRPPGGAPRRRHLGGHGARRGGGRGGDGGVGRRGDQRGTVGEGAVEANDRGAAARPTSGQAPAAPHRARPISV